MPTNYSGVATATQAPSAQPGAGVAPTLAMPNDGEPLNVASLRQNEKVLADFAAWASAPIPLSGSWTTPVWFTQNARAQRRFLVDHMGFPGGSLVGWDEQWLGNLTPLSVTGTGAWETKAELYALSSTFGGTGGQISVNDPNASIGFPRALQMNIGTGGADDAEVWGDAGLPIVPATSFMYETDVYITAIGTPAVTLCRAVFGFTNSSFTRDGSTNDFVGAVFYKANAGGNWMCVTGDGTTLGTPIDSGVAVTPGTVYKLRLEWWGSAVADDTANSVRFYINGSLVGTATANLPSLTPAKAVASPVYILKRDTGAASRYFVVGPVRFRGSY